MSNPFTDKEQECMDALVRAFDIFCNELHETHPNASKDFTDGIHKCQAQLVHRVVQRDYPDKFTTYYA